MVNFERKETYSLQDLIEILRILRAPGGCPWDRAQTHLSDRRNFLEEAYEAAEAFDRDDPALMCEELGDMLMQVLFNIHIEEDAGRFTTDDVTDHICKKLIFRHPHVFGTAAADTSEEVLVNWEALKRQEKGQKTTADALDAVARSLPGLWRAEKIQKKAAEAGFDWRDVSDALDKLDEETAELRQAVRGGTNVEEELGDVLLQVVFHASLEEDAGRFDLDDVADGICKKLIFRHPHVFGDGGEGTAESWEALKRREKGQTTYTATLESVAKSLPGLWRAEKLQSKAEKARIEWPNVQAAVDKLAE